MKVRPRKSLWIVAAILLVSSVALWGCSDNGGDRSSSASPAASKDGGSSPQKPEPITISVFYGAPGQQVTPDNKIYKKIREELGVTLKEEFLVGDLEQKLGVMIASGDYPDLITASTKLVAAKAVIPLEDLIEQHAPNLKKHYAKVWNKLKDPSDGHIYWLPNYGVFHGKVYDTWYAGPAFWIQKDVLKEFGYPKLKTLDEYFNLIREYVKKHPIIDGQPTIGFTTLAYDWRIFPFINAPEHLTGHPNDGDVVVDNNVAQVFWDKDMTKRYIQELNKLYNEGLMDKEAFTQNYDTYLAKLATGRVVGMFDQHWNFQQAEDSLIAQGKIERTYVGFPLVYEPGIREWYRDRPPVNLNNGFGITVKAKDPVRIIKFLDAVMDEKWQKLFSWGEEGVDYMVRPDGKFYRTPEQRKQQEDTAWKLANKAETLFGYLPKIEGSYSDGNATSPGNQPDEFFESLKPLDKEVLSAYGHKTWTEFFAEPPENPVYYPAWTIDLIEGSEAAVAHKRMVDTMLKYLPKAVMAKPDQFEKVWNEYVTEFRKINIKAYEDRINEQIQWRIKNWSSS